MKKKLIEAIKAKFVGIDDNTAGRLAERTIRKGDPITTDDEVNAAIEAITLSDVLKSVSDFSADDATRKYEAKYGLKDGSPIAKPEPSPSPADTKPAEQPAKKAEKEAADVAKEMFEKLLKELNGKIDALGSDIASIKIGKLTDNRKARLEKVISNLREPQKKAYNRIPVEKMSDDEFDAFINDVSEEVNDILADNRANGSVVTAPLGGVHAPTTNGKEAGKDEIDALIDKFNLPSSN